MFKISKNLHQNEKLKKKIQFIAVFYENKKKFCQIAQSIEIIVNMEFKT